MPGHYERLSLNGVEIATAQKTKGNLWFWYGFGVNTASNPRDLETVKAEAYAAALQYLNRPEIRVYGSVVTVDGKPAPAAAVAVRWTGASFETQPSGGQGSISTDPPEFLSPGRVSEIRREPGRWFLA